MTKIMPGEAQMNENDTTDLVTPKQLAVRLQVSKATLSNWRVTGEGPDFIKMGRRTVRYTRGAVEDWLTQKQS